MVDVGIVQRKTSKIMHCLKRLAPYQVMEEEVFLQNQDAMDIAAHNLYVVLQQLIDLGAHVIADDHLGDMTIMSDIPEILSREGILSGDLPGLFRKMIGFRNLLAHEYGDLDIRIMHRILREHQMDIRRVLDAMLQYTQ